MFDIFEKRESAVRSYCRNFPIMFQKAFGAELFASSGERYIDFFAGAGAINYGHNNPYIKEKVLKYLSDDNILHALDMYTVAKEKFIDTLDSLILTPRNMDHKIMFCGSTGTNAVEAALKLARKNKKRQNVISFIGAFHGMSLGSLALTSDRYARSGAGVPLDNVVFAHYDNRICTGKDSLTYLDWILTNDHSGVAKPAAIFLETVQAEGGVNVASVEWLKGIRQICDKHDILMVCDDIQVGCGRTGTFFSFERANIVPDMIILSKSISGLGFPMSLLLVKPEFDIFGPAEHNGTFRGNQIAFVAATSALEYFVNTKLDQDVKKKELLIKDFLLNEILPLNKKLSIRGIGMIWGIDFSDIDSTLSKEVMKRCVEKHLIIERAGSGDCVLKILPPLIISEKLLLEGLNIIKECIKDVLG